MDEIAFLEELVAIPSPSGEERAVAEFLVDRMATLGFLAQCDEVGNVIGTIGDASAAREVVLLGHMDTVPGIVPIRRHNNRLYGRGAVDAKGPLAVFVMASSRVAPLLAGSLRVVVIGAVEEEAHGLGAHHLAQTRAAPDYAIIGEPSHWEGITLGYKGMLNVEYRLSRPGEHSAVDRPGPAEAAVTFWNQLMTYAEENNDGRSGRFDTLDPALRVFNTSSDGLNDLVGMNIAVRLPPGVEPGEIETRMETWRDSAELTFTGRDSAYRAEKNTPPVRALLRAIRAHGGRPRFKLKTGTSDMNVVGPAWGCPFVAYGPGDSALDHTPDEHIELNEYLRAINTLNTALEILAA